MGLGRTAVIPGGWKGQSGLNFWLLCPISFTAALTLCVTVFVGTPVGGTFIPDRTANSPTILSGDYQEGEAPGQDVSAYSQFNH